MEKEKSMAADRTDTKAVEEKALNYLKSFIEDSKVISPIIADKNKKTCWDRHLYLHTDCVRDKGYLQGRVPIQMKGTEVGRFVTMKWNFKLEKYLDLRKT